MVITTNYPIPEWRPKLGNLDQKSVGIEKDARSKSGRVINKKIEDFLGFTQALKIN